MNGGQYVARALEAYGVSAVFLVPTILSRTLYEIEQRDAIRRVVTHGEKAAAYMADGYARASGRPGVCMAQTVGAANLAAGLRDAYLACSPVVALTGGPYEWSRGRAYYQEIEDFPLFKPVTKFSQQVLDIDRLPDLLEQAFRAATAGRPRPTHLEIAGHSGDVIENAALDCEVPDEHTFAVPAVRSEPEAARVEEAARLLLEAERPVIVAGGGVRWSGAGLELLTLAERLGIPVATSLNAKDTVPGDHPLNVGVPGLYARASANQVLLEADLVFYVGSQTGSQVTLSWQVPPPDTAVIQLDIDASDIGRNYRRAVPLLGDAKLGLTRLLDAVGGAEVRSREQWIARTQELGRRWRDELAHRLDSEDVPMRPERLAAELSRHLPDDALVVSDTGHAGMWSGGYLDLARPGQGYLRAAGSLGWALPAALGAQLAQPERPVVCFTGDGGLWYHVAELETAVRWNIPATIVVNDNRSLNQEIGPYTVAYGGSLHGRHHELWHFADVDLAKLAESIGVRGLTVERAADLEPALEEAISGDGPALIDVATDIEALAPKGRAERAPA